MQIIHTAVSTPASEIRLSEEFLAPYRKRSDPFDTLLARSTYLTKYCREGETWTDTIRRVVEGNAALAPGVSVAEMELMFHLFWTGQAFPPGRGLWTGGVPGIPADARYNCWHTTLYDIDDWCWTANQLMLGGGVGVTLSDAGTLPEVSGRGGKFAIWCDQGHPNFFEVVPEGPLYLNGSSPKYVCEDSREGWVLALRKTLTAAFRGEDLVVDVSKVRQRGAPIRTFGGVACGPGPLSQLLRSVWAIVRGAAGRRLSSVERLDITNHIGLCIKAGNVRRSAILVLGQADDKPFRDAKKDFDAVKSFRHTSNNSIAFESWDQIENFDWKGLVEDNVDFGEPGLLNLALGRKTDPGVKGVNPCFSGDTLIAVADGRNAVSIKQLAEEGKDVPVYSMDRKTGKVEIKMGRHPRITGYDQELVRIWLDDNSHLDVTPNHKCILLDGTEVQAKDLQPGDSLPRFSKALERVKKGGKDYYLVHCDTRDQASDRVFEHRLIARFYFPEEWDRIYTECKSNGFAKTGGLVVHHVDYNQLNNSPDNLRIMSFQDHVKLHGEKDNSGEANGHWSGISNEDLKRAALDLTRKLGHRFSLKDWLVFAKENGLPQKFSPYRVQALGNPIELAKVCALELGLEGAEEDPRVVKTLKSMLEQGYKARIENGVVLVRKKCEMCGALFEAPHGFRERSFCSEICGNAHINSNKDIAKKRTEGVRATYKERSEKTRVEQARVCSALMFKLGRDPNRREWSRACKEEGVPSRIGPTLKFGFRYFTEVLEAGSNYNHKVKRVEKLQGKQTVYNITVDDFHTVAVITDSPSKRGRMWYKGVHVGNCGEVLLHDRESCNLAEVFPSKFEPGTDPVTVFRIATRYCLRQRLTELSDPTANEVQSRLMRLGVGLGGICDFDWTPELLAKWYGVCRREADEYADELGVSRPIAVTTVKPSGSISLLNSVDPGIHAAHSNHYIRRVRIAKNDPMAEAMMSAGVPHEEDVYDKTGYTWVFSFPMHSDSRVTKETQTLRDQFERQATVQEWWSDNAVSASLNFDPKTEKEEMASLLEEFVPRLKSTSLISDSHSYEQAPYEAMEESEYREMVRKIDHDSKLVEGGDMEIDECEGGACPIR